MAEQHYPQWRWRQVLLANLAIIAVYVVAAVLGPLVERAHAFPYVYPSPVYPPPGINLALAVLAGWRILPGIALGRMVAGFMWNWSDPTVSLVDIGFIIGAATPGPLLQAWLGSLAIRRWIDPAIDSGRDVLRFLLLAPLICLVSASFGVPVLAALGQIPAGERLATWVSWWIGDTIGVLLAAPLTWIVCGVPRALWRRRAVLVALPLLVSAAAVVSTYQMAAGWERNQAQHEFRLKAQQMADLIQAEFDEHVRFVETVARALGAAPRLLSRDKFQVIAGGYFGGRPELSGIGWVVRVPLAERAAFEDWARRHIDPDYEIRDLLPDGTLRRAPPRAEYLALLYGARPISERTTQSVLGIDFLGNPARATTARRALATSEPTATAPLRMAPSGAPGILLFKSVGKAGSASAALVVLAINSEAMVRQAASRAGFRGFALDFRDVTDGAAAPVTLSGHAPHPDDFRVSLSYAGRRYLLRFAPADQGAGQYFGLASWIVITAGLMMTGLLGALMLLVSGERARVEGVVHDRTTRLRDREARLQAILDNAADAIVSVDHHGIVVSANAATAALFGYPADRLPGLPFDALVPSPRGESAPLLLARIAHAPPEKRDLEGVNADGERFPLAISVSRVLLPMEHLFVCILRDLSEQQRSQERIYRLAHFDVLTGLENRFALGKRLDEQLAHARRACEPLAVMFIDLDHFKKINDSHGHSAGDQLLVGAAHRMKDLLRDVDTLGRLGGDEFVIVLGGPLTPDSVSAVAVRVVQSLSQPYHLNGATVHSGASVGVALYPGDGEDAPALLRHADTAMYAAKREGRGNFQFFSEEMNAATHEHLLLESRMWTALEHNGFDLHLQAQVQLDTGRVIGAEMLLRWHDTELGSVEPSRFIPVAEECGLILPLGDWVLARAMALLADWQRDGMGGMRLAVNLSARQFSGGALLARLDQLLALHRIDPACLELEITETAAMRDPENTRQLLLQLRKRGFKLAIDDFGTGYSSLAYLKLFAIDRIKIDRGFVRDIETNPNDATIVAATIGLAHSLGLGVVAEGVETHAQWGFLRDKHGDEAQGFLFARPMPVAQFREFVRERAQPVGP
jgi:diguanylate cyclase (GGDEF)-like protein/PAS domain S-box-containing protein